MAALAKTDCKSSSEKMEKKQENWDRTDLFHYTAHRQQQQNVQREGGVKGEAI